MNSTTDQTNINPLDPPQTPSTPFNATSDEPTQNVIPVTQSITPENPPLFPETSIPIPSVFSTTNAPPVNPPSSPSPVALHSEKNQAKSDNFPLKVVGLFLLVTIFGFGGSVAYFGFINKPAKKIAINSTPVTPPQVSEPSPTVKPPENIFITPSISFRNLFSTDVFASDNPFDDTTNPFTGVTENKTQDTDAYQNPFEGQQ